MKKKKIFQSKSLNRIVLWDRLVWFIPVVFFLCDILWLNKEDFVEILERGFSLDVILAMVIIYAAIALLQSFIPFLVLKILFHYAKKQMIKNNTFHTVEDFDYYRDKLEGLSPGAVSLISDLKIEQKKDVAASILKYKEMGILKETNGQFSARNLEDVPLRKSDTYLIEGLIHHTFSMEDDNGWQQLVKQEALDDGYIELRTDIAKKGCRGCCLGSIVRVILIIVAFILCLCIVPKTEELMKILEQAPTDLSFTEQIEYLKQYPEYYPIIAGVIITAFFLLGVLFYPVLFIAGLIGTAINLKLFKRTDLGNEMAECIYGMKNFIHDYSNLSEAEQEQVVLWDDYLIYAVVLEENQRIVDDIIRRRKKL